MKRRILPFLICLPLALDCAAREVEPGNLYSRGEAQAEGRNTYPRGRTRGSSSAAGKKAERLAKKDALTFLSSLERYEVLTSETANGWKVIIQLKDKSPLMSGGRTDYLISRKGDRILDRKSYQ
jgi:hypothetical protein